MKYRHFFQICTAVAVVLTVSEHSYAQTKKTSNVLLAPIDSKQYRHLKAEVDAAGNESDSELSLRGVYSSLKNATTPDFVAVDMHGQKTSRAELLSILGGPEKSPATTAVKQPRTGENKPQSWRPDMYGNKDGDIIVYKSPYNIERKTGFGVTPEEQAKIHTLKTLRTKEYVYEKTIQGLKLKRESDVGYEQLKDGQLYRANRFSDILHPIHQVVAFLQEIKDASLKKGNSYTYSHYLTNDFVFVGPDGAPKTKVEIIADAAQGRPDFLPSFAMENSDLNRKIDKAKISDDQEYITSVEGSPIDLQNPGKKGGTYEIVFKLLFQCDLWGKVMLKRFEVTGYIETNGVKGPLTQQRVLEATAK